MQKKDGGGQLSLFTQDGYAGKMCLEVSQAERRRARISASSCRNLQALAAVPFLSLDLSPGSGNLLGEFYWETLSPWLGGALMLNTGMSPREGRESCLWQILQERVPPKYYLTKKACLGILRRAKGRGKPLPPELEQALKIQAGLLSMDEPPKPPLAFHINQREEVIDLGETAGALMATTNMQMQTFVSQTRPFAAGFSAGAGAKAGGISYNEGVAPTLKASSSGNMMPAVLCLNDQGGKAMGISADCTGTLRAQEHGHQLLVFENHKQDGRFTGPMPVSPTICAGAGMGGNNLPLVAGALTARDCKGADNIYAEQSKLVVEQPHLIRRLTPGECELLQWYELGWTDLPGASDSARYRALGNSVAIPVVQYVLGGIVKFSESE